MHQEFQTICQNRRNPRQGIETYDHALKGLGLIFVRIDEIPVRGLKRIVLTTCPVKDVESQNRRNPRQGIETQQQPYFRCIHVSCQNRRNPRQGIET